MEALTTVAPRLRVVIADDQEMVRSGIRMILEAHDIEVVGEAGDGREAVTLAQRLRPDVCLLDIRMPKLDGLEATRILSGPGVPDPIPVVVVTTFDLDEYVRVAITNGASGFLLKDAGPALLAEAVRAAASGDALVSPSITVRFLRHFANQGVRASRSDPIVPLTEREEDIVARPRARPHQLRDRRRAVHLAEHGEEPHRQHPDQARRPQPRGDRRLGLGDRPHALTRPLPPPPGSKDFHKHFRAFLHDFATKNREHRACKSSGARNRAIMHDFACGNPLPVGGEVRRLRRGPGG